MSLFDSPPYPVAGGGVELCLPYFTGSSALTAQGTGCCVFLFHLDLSTQVLRVCIADDCVGVYT